MATILLSDGAQRLISLTSSMLARRPRVGGKRKRRPAPVGEWRKDGDPADGRAEWLA